MNGYRLGIDVGGTNTDVLLVDGANRNIHKVPTREDPSKSTIRGIIDVCERADIAPGDIDRMQLTRVEPGPLQEARLLLRFHLGRAPALNEEDAEGGGRQGRVHHGGRRFARRGPTGARDE